MSQQKIKLMVLGLDGATFDIIDPLIKAGKLPNLARITDDGAHGNLQSIIPPVTGPAWPVLATGRNPGKLGTYDFVNRRSLDDVKLYPISSQDLAGQTFWDSLNAAGYRVGVFNYPMVVPAYPINGWMISGLGADKLHEYAYPADLKQELEEVTGGYDITVMYGQAKYENNLPLLVEDMKELLKRRIKALEHLLTTRPVDALVGIFTISDVASHTMWHFWDDSDPDHNRDPQHEAMREEFISIWQTLDTAVGKALAHLDPEGHLLIVSDHGFGSSFGVFNLNHWLQESGYLLRKSSNLGSNNQLRQWVVKKTSPVLNPVYKKMMGTKAHQLLRASVLREVDVTATKAFALENSDSCGMVYVNRQYARDRGLDEEQFVRETREQVKTDLIHYGQREGLDIQAYTSDEIYEGAYADLAPDVILIVDNLRCSVSYHFDGPTYEKRFHHPLKYGTHRFEAILMAHGPRIKPGKIEGAQLQDIAPTLLHLSDLPIASEVDGRVLIDMIKPEFRESVASKAESDEVVPTKIAVNVKEEDHEAVLQRLADLGYLD